MLVYQAGINDNDYRVVMGMCGEDRGNENVWRSLKKFLVGEKKKKKRQVALRGWGNSIRD